MRTQLGRGSRISSILITRSDGEKMFLPGCLAGVLLHGEPFLFARSLLAVAAASAATVTPLHAAACGSLTHPLYIVAGGLLTCHYVQWRVATNTSALCTTMCSGLWAANTVFCAVACGPAGCHLPDCHDSDRLRLHNRRHEVCRRPLASTAAPA